MDDSWEDPAYIDSTDKKNLSLHLKTTEAYPPKPFPEDAPKKNQTLKFIVSILLFGAVYYFFVSKNLEIITWLAIIVLIHELGHYFAMKIFNYEDLSIFFIPLLGAIAGGNKEKISQKEKVIVLLAGPVPGIIIGITIFFFASHGESYSLLRLSYAFVLINILNLLPLYPLDGGQLLQTLFLGSRQIITNIFIIASVILLVVYAVSNHEWFLLIIPYFLVTRLLQERELFKMRTYLDKQQIDYKKSYAELSDEEYWRIRDVIIKDSGTLAKNNLTADRLISEKENEVINAVKAVLKIKPLKDLSIIGIALFLVLWVAAIAVPLLLMTRIWMMI